MLRMSNFLRKPSGSMRGLRFLSHQGVKAMEDSNLLEILRSEINYELTSESSENDGNGSLGDFVIEWDSPKSKDVLLRRKSRSGEEVAVSALFGGPKVEVDEADHKSPVAADVQMKVCIRKPGLSSILQFDCEVRSIGEKMSRFDIESAYCIPSASSLGSSLSRGPLFSDLDPRLQGELRKFLEAKGIGESLLNFLLFHLRQKEQHQYVDWLGKLESALA